MYSQTFIPSIPLQPYIQSFLIIECEEERVNRILPDSYVEYGSGDPIIFLHGNPTSSYIWRKIIPYVQGLGRCIAPDLPGMGDSEKLADPNAYTFTENQNHLDLLFQRLGITGKILFVVHDW